MNKSLTGKSKRSNRPYILASISALEEILKAYCEERKLRPINSISQLDAKYAVDLKHRIRELILMLKEQYKSKI